MLANEKLFEKLEDSLREKGKIQAFEKENGPITGRMMIMPVDLPDNIDIKMIPGKKPVAFEATFDFYNVALGIALYPELEQVASKIWVTPQTDNPDDPDGHGSSSLFKPWLRVLMRMATLAIRSILSSMTRQT